MRKNDWRAAYRFVKTGVLYIVFRYFSKFNIKLRTCERAIIIFKHISANLLHCLSEGNGADNCMVGQLSA